MGGRLRRAGDLLARYGGEEFAALLPDTKLKGALALAESCRRAVEELAVVHEDSLAAPVVTVSLGAAAMIPDEGQTPQDLIQAADQALYRAKDGGRNRVEAAETISVLEASEV
jgi:diguanylate cyclase (GGDEF)-like protein